MIAIDDRLQPADLLPALQRMWELSAAKLFRCKRRGRREQGTPVFTVGGRYTSQGWTEWTQGFQFGSAILQFDATGDERFLELGRSNTIERMASHVTHIGVHDHGFNNVSTYGNLRRLMLEGRFPYDARELEFYELALKASGAVQAARWSKTSDGHGYIYSFNGPHSLFSDTIRSLRALALAHRLGHTLMAENDAAISLLDRLVQHARTTAKYNVYYGEGRDAYDVRGRVAHESIFNTNDGRYRCPSTQQGYSPFSTWTRGLAWIMCGYAEQLEFLAGLDDAPWPPWADARRSEPMLRTAAAATCDFYLDTTPTDGVPYWDTGAPGLVHWGITRTGRRTRSTTTSRWTVRRRRSPPRGCCDWAGTWKRRGDAGGRRYWQAGLTVLKTLLAEPYLSVQAEHQGLLLHTIYHRPRGWDYVPPGSKIPCGESCLWGDYHLREVGLYVQRLARGEPYYTFFAP